LTIAALLEAGSVPTRLPQIISSDGIKIIGKARVEFIVNAIFIVVAPTVYRD
jgi:hypothetical protein